MLALEKQSKKFNVYFVMLYKDSVLCSNMFSRRLQEVKSINLKMHNFSSATETGSLSEQGYFQ